MVTWIKRFGVVGFTFFLVKGLAWLIVPLMIAKAATTGEPD